MYYSMYANEALALDNWDSYNECNWLLTNFLSKDYRKSIEEKVDFYFAHRHERHRDDDGGYYASSTMEFTAEDFLKLEKEYYDYQDKKFMYEDFMEDFYDADDAWEYENDSMAYQEFYRDDFYERLSKYFENKSFMKDVRNGKKVSIKIYDWLKEDDDDMYVKFEKKMAKNEKMKTKLREVSSVILYQSDIDNILKARREYNLTELQTQVCFGLIFMSRMSGIKFCRIGTTYKSKGFWSAFDKHISPEDKARVWETGLFSTYVSKKKRAHGVHIEDEVDKIYECFDVKDGGIGYEFITTVENNRLNFSKMCKEAIPNLRNRHCVVCGEEFVPTNNSQRQCLSCKEKYKREQANERLRKHRAAKKI